MALDMDDFKQKLKKAGFKGEVIDDLETRELYSHDASIFEIRPELVVAPQNIADLQKLVKTVAANKPKMPQLSLTARSAGTDMAGGAVNESIIVDFVKHFSEIEGISDD
jgi:FAD/FMN-containing dehydrogenase